MEVIPRLSTRLFPAPTAETVPTIRRNAVIPPSFLPTCRSPFLPIPRFRDRSLRYFSRSSSRISASGWFSGFGPKKEFYPDIVKAGDPVLHEPAREVTTEEIGSEKIEKIIDSMIMAMRKAPGVGLAAPQIGVPLKIIVLEDTKEYIGYASKREIEAQDRRPFNLLVILNPVLERKGNKTALFFEGCLSSMNPNYEATQPTVDGMSSKADVAAARRPNVQEFNVDGYRGMVERHLEVEVTGLDRAGNPIKVVAKGWQARILQHECDHLDGTVYVDKMLPRTFRSVENLGLPLPAGCPKLGNR